MAARTLLVAIVVGGALAGAPRFEQTVPHQLDPFYCVAKPRRRASRQPPFRLRARTTTADAQIASESSRAATTVAEVALVDGHRGSAESLRISAGDELLAVDGEWVATWSPKRVLALMKANAIPRSVLKRAKATNHSATADARDKRQVVRRLRHLLFKRKFSWAALHQAAVTRQAAALQALHPVAPLDRGDDATTAGVVAVRAGQWLSLGLAQRDIFEHQGCWASDLISARSSFKEAVRLLQAPGAGKSLCEHPVCRLALSLLQDEDDATALRLAAQRIFRRLGVLSSGDKVVCATLHAVELLRRSALLDPSNIQTHIAIANAEVSFNRGRLDLAERHVALAESALAMAASVAPPEGNAQTVTALKQRVSAKVREVSATLDARDGAALTQIVRAATTAPATAPRRSCDKVCPLVPRRKARVAVDDYVTATALRDFADLVLSEQLLPSHTGELQAWRMLTLKENATAFHLFRDHKVLADRLVDVQAIARTLACLPRPPVIYMRQAVDETHERALRALGQYFNGTGGFVLVTSHNDNDAPGRWRASILLEPWLLHWFGVNAEAAKRHSKFTPMPLGVEGFGSRGYLQPLHIEAHLKKLEAAGGRAPSQLLLVNFGVSTSAERSSLWQRFCGGPASQRFATCLQHGATGRDGSGEEGFLDLASDHRFWLSPSGNGADCYRTYEALYTGSVPVVLRSAMDTTAFLRERGDGKLDMPVLMVDSWEQVTEKFLQHAWQEQFSRRLDRSEFPRDKLNMSYWRSQIEHARTFTLRDGACVATQRVDSVRERRCW